MGKKSCAKPLAALAASCADNLEAESKEGGEVTGTCTRTNTALLRDTGKCVIGLWWSTWTMRNNAVLVSGAGAQERSGEKTEGVRQHGWICGATKGRLYLKPFPILRDVPSALWLLY